MPVAEIIKTALDAAWPAIGEELGRVPLLLWNESVFRFFFIRSLLRLYPHAACQSQIEWNRFDLLLQADAEIALVEFKFYGYNVHRDVAGGVRRMKGAPGTQNFRATCECLSKLAGAGVNPGVVQDGGQTASKFLILAYSHKDDVQTRRTYPSFYDPFCLPLDLAGYVQMELLRSWRAIFCPQTGYELFCKLFEIA